MVASMLETLRPTNDGGVTSLTIKPTYVCICIPICMQGNPITGYTFFASESC